jgi:hypothetical protein
MPWADTTAGVLKIRNAANSGWITLYQLDGEWSTIALEDGTAAAPSIYFKDSGTDTGVYSPGTDQVAIATAGVQRVNFSTTEVVFNDGGNDVDFRIEGATEPNLFKIDAGTDQVRVKNLNGGPLAGTRNRIINGDMRIDQRYGGASVVLTAGVTYTVDRWAAVEDTDGSVTVQQSTTAPPGFTNSLLATVTSADASLAATQRTLLFHSIEGFNTADLNFGTASASTITISFWVRSSVTGSFGAAVTNVGGGISSFTSYPFAYAISAANTWEYKTVTIPGSTSGTWLKNNLQGLALIFGLGVGSTFSGTANTWAANDLNSVTGATNLMATNGATFYITGVQLEAGAVATPFERRSYGQELALCQRYYERQEFGALYGFTISNDSQYRSWGAPFAVTKRAAPSIAFSLGNIAPSSPFTTTKGWVATQASLGASTGYYVANVALSAEL